MPRHHPADATLLAHAAGALSEGLSLVVAAHLALCPECRANLALAEGIGGSLLDKLVPVPLAADARDKALDRIADILPDPPPRQPGDWLLLPPPLARYLGTALDAIRWRIIAPGMALFDFLPRGLIGSARLRLVRIAGGGCWPRHGHAGTELTLVLAGAYSDVTGRFACGDLADSDPGLVHEAVASREEDCVCLVGTEGGA